MESRVTIGTVERQRGFTLIEITIAIFILTIALLGLISVTTMVIKGNSFSQEMTTATTLARDKLEETKDKPYSAVTGGVTVDYLNKDSSPGAAGAFYTRTLTVDASNAEMKAIQVEVSWSWMGITRRVKLNTIMADTG